MNSNQRFLKNAQIEANESWLSVEGNDWDAEGDWDADGETSEWGAEGEWEAAGGNATSLSSPYVIKLVNACTTAIANVDVGDAAIQQFATNQGANTNITITNNISGGSYIGWLGTTNTKPFMVGKTMVVSATAGQLNETLLMTHTDPNGDAESKYLDLVLDPNQNQTDRVSNFRPYLFDGYTRVRFSNIVASGTTFLYLYPLQKYSASAVLSGHSPIRTYAPPKTVVPVMQTRGGYSRRPVKRLPGR